MERRSLAIITAVVVVVVIVGIVAGVELGGKHANPGLPAKQTLSESGSTLLYPVSMPGQGTILTPP